jgi:hypothetical protein
MQTEKRRVCGKNKLRKNETLYRRGKTEWYGNEEKLRDKEVESEAIHNKANRKRVTFFLPTTTACKELPAGHSYLRTCTGDSAGIIPTRIPHQLNCFVQNCPPILTVSEPGFNVWSAKQNKLSLNVIKTQSCTLALTRHRYKQHSMTTMIAVLCITIPAMYVKGIIEVRISIVAVKSNMRYTTWVFTYSVIRPECKAHAP